MHIHSANYQKKQRAYDIFASKNNLLFAHGVRIHINANRMVLRKFFTLALLLLSVTVLKAEVQDSVGTKVKNGKIFIMHKVEKGQGLYSIGRRYGVPYKVIMAANPGSETRLLEGQIILVPTGKDAPMEEKVVKEYFEEKKNQPEEKPDPRIKEKTGAEVRSTFAKFHVVKSGETLYGISKQYNTTTKVLMDLNEMKSSAISVGQKILVPVAEADAQALEKKVDDTKKKVEDLQKETETVQKEVEVRKNDTKNPVASAYSKQVDAMPEFDVEKITETGNLFFSDENELRTSKKVASHHEAKIGTTIMVTNPANNKAIFVKVVKNHAMDDDSANMILIPAAVATKIGIQDGQSVSTSYAR